MAKQSNVPGANPGQINMVAEGTVFEGTLRASGDVRISGRIVGALHVDGKVIVTQEGAVDGELHATNADIAGEVQGEIQVSDRLVLRNTARVDSSVKTSRFVMEEGAIFGGKCQMGEGRTVGPAGERSGASVEKKPGAGSAAGGSAAGGSAAGKTEQKEAPQAKAKEASSPSDKVTTSSR